MSATQKLEQLINELHEARQRFKADATEAFKAGTKEFFEQNPEVKAIGWTQYAPYFNDGEPCEFRVNDIYATVLDPNDDEFSKYELANGEYAWGDERDATSPAAKEFVSLLSRVPDDLYESLFGSDSIVLITRDGVESDSYEDHD